jgi:hypothetical protein
MMDFTNELFQNDFQFNNDLFHNELLESENTWSYNMPTLSFDEPDLSSSDSETILESPVAYLPNPIEGAHRDLMTGTDFSRNDFTMTNLFDLYPSFVNVVPQQQLQTQKRRPDDKNMLSTISEPTQVAPRERPLKKAASDSNFVSNSFNASSSTPSEIDFFLMQQPDTLQRKSYKNETRYLNPQPMLTCCQTRLMGGHCEHKLKGKIHVYIADKDGVILEKQNTLLQGDVEVSLDNNFAKIKVKALFFSPDPRCLVFRVSYQTQDGQFKMKDIRSRPFIVRSRKFNNNNSATLVTKVNSFVPNSAA